MAKDSFGEWLGVFAVGYIGYLILTGVWYSKARYYLEYGLSPGLDWSQVTREKTPHDCTWLAAPLGDKYCHYDAKVSSTQVSKDANTGKPVYSYDNGKTWNWIDPAYPITPSVDIEWVKVDD